MSIRSLVKENTNLDGLMERVEIAEASLEEMRRRVESLSRRLEELEYSAFQLEDEEEVVLITVPRRLHQK